MEVSLDNAVPFTVKITLLPGQKIYRELTKQCMFSVRCSINFLLNKPSLTLILISVWLILLLPLLLYSFLTTLAVCCFMWSILIFEGFVILSLLLLSTIGTSIVALLTVSWVCLQNKAVT